MRYLNALLLMALMLVGCSPASMTPINFLPSSPHARPPQIESASFRITLSAAQRELQAVPSNWKSAVVTLENGTLLDEPKTATIETSGSNTLTAVFRDLRIGPDYRLAVNLFDQASGQGTKLARGLQANISLIGGTNAVVIKMESPRPEIDALPDTIYDSGSLVFLSGSFWTGGTATFEPSNLSAPLNILSTTQAIVTVPSGAQTGTLKVADLDGMSNSVDIKVARYSLGMSRPFARRYDQATGARSMPRLTTARHGHVIAARGPFVYAIGGASGGTALTASELGLLNMDGTVGAFLTSGAPNLGTAREGLVGVSSGGSYYAIGGKNSGGALTSVEAASWQSDQSLGAFGATAHSLQTARSYAAGTVIGSYLYVFGGEGADGHLATVERAPLNDSGALIGGFSLVPEVSLKSGRSKATVAIAAGRVYLMGGRNASGPLSSVEVATIRADGSISDFVTRTEGLTAAREGASAIMLGNGCYVLGGRGPGGELTSIEKATVSVTGLGAFEALTTSSLIEGRSMAPVTVLGDYLYLFGGSNAGASLATSEFATLNSSGKLSTFGLKSASLSSARYGNGSVVLGTGLFVLGGQSSSGTLLSTIERALFNRQDEMTGVGAAGVALDKGRANFTMVVVGPNLWLFAGDGGGGANDAVAKSPISSTGTLGTFSTVSGVSPGSVSGANSIVIDNTLFVIGGLTNNSVTNATRNGGINANWDVTSFGNNGPSLPQGRARGVVLTLGNYIYYIGGQTDQAGTAANNVYRVGVSATGTVSGNFTAYSTLNVARVAPSAMVVGSRLYLIGGTSGSTYTGIASVESAPILPDGSLGAFELEPGIVLDQKRGFHASSLIGNQLFVMGGRDGTALASTEGGLLQ